MTYRERLLGAWRLVSFSVAAPDGTLSYPMGRDLVGLIVYTPDGYMSVQLMGPDRPRFDTPAYGVGSDLDWARAARGYFAYAGRYTVDEQAPAVTHHVEMALNPYWPGRDQKRGIELRGDDLILSGESPTPSGAIHTALVHWRRAR